MVKYIQNPYTIYFDLNEKSILDLCRVLYRDNLTYLIHKFKVFHIRAHILYKVEKKVNHYLFHKIKVLFKCMLIQLLKLQVDIFNVLKVKVFI